VLRDESHIFKLAGLFQEESRVFAGLSFANARQEGQETY
jgi:hypothetical protein